VAYTDIRFTDGFESGDLTTGGWAKLLDGAADALAAAAHSGAYGLRMVNTGSQSQILRKTLAATIDKSSIRFWVRPAAGGASRQLGDARDAGGGHVWDLYWDAATGALTCYVFKPVAGGSVQLDAPAGAVPVGAWTQIEIEVDAVSSGAARLLVGGTIAEQASDDFSRAQQLQMFQFFNGDGPYQVDFDDVQVAAWQDVAPDTTPPTAPSGLTATVLSAHRVSLAWGAATDAVGVASYLVERDGTQIAVVTSGLAYSDTAASPATTYSYRVRATDAAGNIGPYSNVASATTPADAPADAGLAGLMEAIADALQPLTTEIGGLQIYPYLNSNPTPPSLDLYPGDPFQTGAGFGVGQSQVFFTIRARISTADQEAGQKLLLRMLDPGDPASVEAAVEDVATVVPEGISGFREYLEDSSTNGRLLGCEWRVSTFL
jgi:hypothetical protein